MSFVANLGAVTAGTANLGTVQNQAMAINTVLDNILNPITERRKKKKKRLDDKMALLDQAALAGGIYTGFIDAYNTGVGSVIKNLLPSVRTKEGKTIINTLGYIPRNDAEYIIEDRDDLEDAEKIKKLGKLGIKINIKAIGWDHKLDSYNFDNAGNLIKEAQDPEGTFASTLHDAGVTEEQLRKEMSESESDISYSDSEAMTANEEKINRITRKKQFRKLISDTQKTIEIKKPTGEIWGKDAFSGIENISDIDAKTVKNVANSLLHKGPILDKLVVISNTKPKEFEKRLIEQIKDNNLSISNLKTLTGLLDNKEGRMKKLKSFIGLKEGSSEQSPMKITKNLISKMEIKKEAERKLEKARTTGKVHEIAYKFLNKLDGELHNELNEHILEKLGELRPEESDEEVLRTPVNPELQKALEQQEETLEILTEEPVITTIPETIEHIPEVLSEEEAIEGIMSDID